MRLLRKVTRPKGESSDSFAAVDLNFPRHMRGGPETVPRAPFLQKAVESWDRMKIPTSLRRPCRNDISEINISCTIAAVIEAGVCGPAWQSFVMVIENEKRLDLQQKVLVIYVRTRSMKFWALLTALPVLGSVRSYGWYVHRKCASDVARRMLYQTSTISRDLWTD
jgi:hypothetical protein